MPHTGNAPSLTKHKNFRKVIIVLIALSLTLVFALQYKKEQAKSKAERAKAQAQAEIQKKPQTFILPACDKNDACEEVPTFDAGPGTRHRIRADAPYRAVSVQSDGKRITYPMPAGWETWTGAAPAGKLRLTNAKGAKTETLVEVLREQ